ncbi:WDR12-like ribosome biogenesis protein [Chloropicon primus]|uniref:Ribosome biogenesis protein WDR12 homolog n=2 Tax=Chloropicon primus TaxID=1764295 RepID=A0A5B8MNV9_9CHLO|nr:WDR12-like ribosome biogenesis protein [Chloropicon primus]|eukprot:QDZ22179.1 WDR12-like ribosome biogenesis protein [Chloropicon primus]
METDASQKVLCRFVTKLPDELKVPSTDIALPSNSTRYGLSQTINALLSTADEDDEEGPKVFDFLVSGELLRGELARHLAKRGLSVEKTIVIEYFFALEPPQPPKELDLPDWVGAVRGHGDLLFSGSYDGGVSMHRTSSGEGEVLQGSKVAHSDSVSALAVVKVSEEGPQGDDSSVSSMHGGGQILVTASKDSSMRGWFVNKAGGEAGGDGGKRRRKKGAGGKAGATGLDLVQVFEFVGHTGGVESVASSPGCGRFCSGGWDQKVRVWSIDEEDIAGAQLNAAKKQKKATEELPENTVSLEQVETTFLEGHKQCISSVCWPEENLICSASWDCTVKCFDVSKGKMVSNLIRDSALFCLDSSRDAGHSGSLSLAFGSADGLVAVWDPRESFRAKEKGTGMALATVKSFKSHKAVVADIRWSPSSPFHFASCDYDGLVKVWDMRSSMPLHSIELHGDKALCLDWFSAGTLASGGADRKVALQGMAVMAGEKQ